MATVDALTELQSWYPDLFRLDRDYIELLTRKSILEGAVEESEDDLSQWKQFVEHDAEYMREQRELKRIYVAADDVKSAISGYADELKELIDWKAKLCEVEMKLAVHLAKKKIRTELGLS